MKFQAAVLEWMLACFGADIAGDRVERNHRFLEEALELVQATGCTREHTKALVDYVFDRPVGEVNNEVGGVLLTLAALCSAAMVGMDECAEAELRRVWTKIDVIRAKQAAKPRFSPLPAGEYVVKSRAGQYLDDAGGVTWAPAFAKHFAATDVAGAAAAQRPQDEGWEVIHAPHL